MDPQNTATPDNSPIVAYVNPSLSKFKKLTIFFIILITILIILAVLLYIFYSRKPQPKPVNQKVPHYKTLIEQGVQSAGGIIATDSAKISPPASIGPSPVITAKIYQKDVDSISFLTEKNQLLTFTYKKMTLFTKAENLKINQQVNLKITSNIETGEIDKVIVSSN